MRFFLGVTDTNFGWQYSRMCFRGLATKIPPTTVAVENATTVRNVDTPALKL